MASFALALALALASAGPPPLAPTSPPDPGPFRGSELALATAGTFLGDAAVLGAAYGTLQLFASGALQPSATNFRHAAFAMGGAALFVPPLASVLLARAAGRPPGVGSAWRALLLASAGELAALAAGYLAAPHFWVVLPAQLLTVVVATSLGLHWGGRAAAAAPLPDAAAPAPLTPPSVNGRPAAPDERPASALLLVPVCPAT
jgi:hypothetical protein